MNVKHICTIKGIPVGVNFSFLILVVLLAMLMGNNNLVYGIICGICIIIALMVHEFGHALVAAHYNLNPQVILTGSGGLTIHKSANAKQSFLITLMGPLSGLVLGGIALGVYFGLAVYAPTFLSTYTNFAKFLEYSMFINLGWGIFNLIPINPLDGGKLLSALLAKFMAPKTAIKTSVVVSTLCCVAFIVLSCTIWRSMFNLFVGFYLLMINFLSAKQVFSSISTLKKEKASLRADTIYEMGISAARDHRWKELEMYGHQLKEASSSSDQLKSAYDFLTIACTNQKKYEEALNYAERSSKSESVQRAVDRCRHQLTVEKENSTDA